MNNLDERRDESLIGVQDAFSTVETIAANVLNRAQKTRDAYLIGGIEELIGAIGSLKNAVSIKIACNGLKIGDAKQKEAHGG